ncbi:putative RDD family membrane protein YckC [Fontibacillus solani]|uniref:Putative RDD family membrane protein YckC n=1 Tax=Fontibacillus solani TaxID=1572857 RepID=A0A7W3SV70_9BACL|nr:RDD family protein [Fontibacillus solani]MBA9086850.1 putative RDD family membrane protein YckC [Fontibacillus solani]
MKYASFWMRLLAIVCDYIIVLFIVFIASFIITVFQRFSTTYEEVILYNVLRYPTYLVFIWLYYSLMESSKYQGTLGKKLFKIKVTNLEGEKVSFGRSTGRFFARLLSMLTFNIGFLIVSNSLVLSE